jgi:hypothetical protein
MALRCAPTSFSLLLVNHLNQGVVCTFNMAKKPNLEALALSFADEAMARVVEVMRNAESDATALRAAEHIIKYAFPPKVASEVSEDMAKLSPQERIEALREALNEELESIEVTPAPVDGRA